MSSTLMIALILVIIAIIFPFIAFISRYIGKISRKEEDDHYSEIKASILFLNIALPTALFLLGAFGFTSYDTIVNKVTDNVTNTLKKEMNRAKVEALIQEIDMLNRQAKEDAESIRILKTAMDDTINQQFEKFSRIFPVGTIIPYSGSRDSINFEYWAVCDGNNGTPNLRDRFILGSNFPSMGEKGGTSKHIHKVTAAISGQVNKKNAIMYPFWDGTGKKREFEQHEHTLKLSTPKVGAEETRHLPPYIRLVYLMKIK